MIQVKPFLYENSSEDIKFQIMICSILRRTVTSILLVVVLWEVSLPASAQQNDKPSQPSAENVAKAEAVIKHAIDVLGGNTYLSVKTVVGRGFFTTFQEGMSQIPARFLDYISYPDRERTEFTSEGIRAIQTNTGETGWLYDGANRVLADLKAPQIEDFKRSMRTSTENLLHGWWKKEGATLSYIGRREAGLARRNETIRLTYPDGFWIEYEFGAKDGLPAKVIYRRSRKKADTEETEDITEEDRLAKPITIAGVTAPWVIDHYINGVQTSRINYESIVYNQPLDDSLFLKPANVKILLKSLK